MAATEAEWKTWLEILSQGLQSDNNEELCTWEIECTKVALWKPVWDQPCECPDYFCTPHRDELQAWAGDDEIRCERCGMRFMKLTGWRTIR